MADDVTPHSAAFLSSPSIRRATFSVCDCFSIDWFLSSPSIRRATAGARADLHPTIVSILALHTEGDASRMAMRSSGVMVSILALHTEGDAGADGFQRVGQTVSILALHTEGDQSGITENEDALVSILALHTEGDDVGRDCVHHALQFLSSPSIRRATVCAMPLAIPSPFLSSPSIRRATCAITWRAWTTNCFYPRPPYGGRRTTPMHWGTR